MSPMLSPGGRDGHPSIRAGARCGSAAYTPPVLLLDRFETPWRLLLKEISAFGVVGLINLFIDVGLFNLLHFGLGIGPLTSKFAATAVSVTSAYVMHRHWSFSHRARTGVRREYPLFFLINAVALLMGLAVLAVARYGLGLDGVLSLNLANLVGTAIGTTFRFLAYKRWVFMAAPVRE